MAICKTILPPEPAFFSNFKVVLLIEHTDLCLYSPSLISLMVSVDVTHHAYLLTYACISSKWVAYLRFKDVINNAKWWILKLIKGTVIGTKLSGSSANLSTKK